MNNKLFVLLLVGVIAFGGAGIVNSYSGSTTTVIEHADTIIISAADPSLPANLNGDSVSVRLGAYGDTNVTNLVASGDITGGDDMTVADELTVDDATFTCFDQTFVDATTTSVAIPATSIFSSGSMTIVSFTYNNSTAATSTHSVDCGVAADAFTTGDTLIDGLSVSTSTTAYETGDYGTNGRVNQALDTTEYVTCTVTLTGGAAYDGAFLDGGNTYDGVATVCAIQ